jgi:hypothetical protein
LSQIVGDNEVRAVGRHHNPKTLHFAVFRKPFEFDQLAVFKFIGTPIKRIDSSVRLLSTSSIDLTIVFEWIVINLFPRLNEQHQVFSGIPGVHQHRLKRQSLVIGGLPRVFGLFISILLKLGNM